MYTRVSNKRTGRLLDICTLFLIYTKLKHYLSHTKHNEVQALMNSCKGFHPQSISKNIEKTLFHE